jgi:thermitase
MSYHRSLLLAALLVALVPPPARAASTDPLLVQDWGLATGHVLEAWGADPAVAHPVVAVIDSGITPVADLDGALAPGADLLAAGVPVDDLGHGTLVAGVIAARADNGIGIAGVCPACVVMPIRVVDGSGSTSAASIAQAVIWATDHGARVINMSFVLAEPSADVGAAVTYAEEHGVVLVASAGNDGNTVASYPAAYDGVLGVAATDATGALYDWSRRGSWVRVAAPGCLLSTAPDASYEWFCGTSAATAFVAGVAGLLLAADPGATASDVSGAIAAHASPTSPATTFGVVDAASALAQLLPPMVSKKTAPSLPRARRSKHKHTGGPPKRASRVVVRP